MKITKRNFTIGVLLFGFICTAIICCIVFGLQQKSTASDRKISDISQISHNREGGLDAYSWEEVRLIADNISTLGKCSDWFEEFENYAKTGACKKVLLKDQNNNVTDTLLVRIIGINSDILDPHDRQSDNKEKRAGLTFMSCNALKDSYERDERYTSGLDLEHMVSRAWKDTQLSSYLKEGGAIYNQFPKDLLSNLTEVYKQNDIGWEDVIYTQRENSSTEDKEKLFILSVSEFNSKYYQYLRNTPVLNVLPSVVPSTVEGPVLNTLTYDGINTILSGKVSESCTNNPEYLNTCNNWYADTQSFRNMLKEILKKDNSDKNAVVTYRAYDDIYTDKEVNQGLFRDSGKLVPWYNEYFNDMGKHMDSSDELKFGDVTNEMYKIHPASICPCFCLGDGRDVQTHTVTFETYGATKSPAPQIVIDGDKIKKPKDNPEIDNKHIFTGWYKSENFKEDNKFDFDNNTITEDTVIYAGGLRDWYFKVYMTGEDQPVVYKFIKGYTFSDYIKNNEYWKIVNEGPNSVIYHYPLSISSNFRCKLYKNDRIPVSPNELIDSDSGSYYFDDIG